MAEKNNNNSEVSLYSKITPGVAAKTKSVNSTSNKNSVTTDKNTATSQTAVKKAQSHPHNPAAKKPYVGEKSPASAIFRRNVGRPYGRAPTKLQSEMFTEPENVTLVNTRKLNKRAGNASVLRVVSLGGINEIGKNLTCYEYENDMIIVDCGMTFPDDDMPGVDIVIPDFTYVLKNKDRIKGIVITHGHEDHIGALPYLLRECSIPVYGTRLTLGLVEGKLREHHLNDKAKLNVCKPGDEILLGIFKVELINVNHSIPDAVALAIKSPAGVCIHTGDFKIDSTPIDDKIIDIARFSQLGKEGVLALMSDSTNAERPGFTMSERKVGESLSALFKQGENKRILVATFSSNIHRLQQIIDEAVKYKRKVVVSGRSMINVVTIATELGYLKIPENILIDIDLIRRYTPEQLVIITTGSQGEQLSALHRMAFSDHRKIEISPSDMIIISASPIPGNEKTVGKVINELLKLGADVIYDKMYDIHVSGHACQEELKLMISMCNPQYFIPVHGEQRQLRKHAMLAESMGISKKNIIISDIGKVIEIRKESIRLNGIVPSGKVLVDGLGVGDVGSIVLRDRKHLAEDGLLVVVMTMDSASGSLMSGPDIVSRGFVYVREAEGLMEQTKSLAIDSLMSCIDSSSRDWSAIKTKIRDDISKFIYDKTKRSPMILPIIMEI